MTVGNETLDEVARIFGRLLEIDEVAADDNFFEVGGDSFTALSLIDGVRERFGVEVALIDLIRSATPLEISRLIDERVPGR